MKEAVKQQGCACGTNDMHGHEHHHSHASGSVKGTVVKIIISFALAAAALALVTIFKIETRWMIALFYLPAFLVIGLRPLIEAIQNIFQGNLFDENFLMIIASVGSFILGDYLEGMAVMLLFQTGEVFQSIGVAKSRKSISGLMDMKPESANRQICGRPGQYEAVEPDRVLPGDILLVKTGEKIPIDGVVTEGESSVDTSALTGESMPTELKPGSAAVSGCIVLGKPILMRVTKEYRDSTVARILYLVENASERKSKSENFITKFAKIYTPAVVLCAVILALFPPLVLSASWSVWINRALTFLVISCPCALVISVPLSFYMGIGAASKRGILIKGSQYVDTLAKAEIVAFDKTGTLTKGKFEVTQICASAHFTEEELLRTLAYAESFSNHPIAKSVVEYFTRQTGMQPDQSAVSDFEELPGAGIRAVVSGKTILAGNSSVAADPEQRAQLEEIAKSCDSAIIFACIDGIYGGYLTVSDTIKPEAAESIRKLKEEYHVRKTVMVTGDRESTARQIGALANVDAVYAKCLPEDKVERLNAVKKEVSAAGSLLFVGDGINDAPVLACADVGIAMGGIGSDAAIEAADVVIMQDTLSAAAEAVGIAKKTVSTAKANIVFSLAVKGAILLLSAFGISNMWVAVFADVGVSILAICNALLIGKRVK